MTSQSKESWSGVRSSVPVIISAAPFGALFGALAIDNGLTVLQTVLMSMTVYAGASQMVGIELFGNSVAPWLIVLSIFAVNFRHVLYSAVVGRHIGHYDWWRKAAMFFFLIDPQYAASEARHESGKPIGFVWYMAMGVTTYLAWAGATLLGALFGKLVQHPEVLGLDFLLPVYFLGLVMGFRKRVNWLPVVLVSGVVAVLAYKFVGSPWHVSIGAIAGIALAAIIGVKPGHKPVV